MLQRCRCGRDSLLHFYKRVYRHTGIGTFDGSGHAAFFLLAMYEKDGFPAEKILYFMIRQKFLTPGIRPYKSENIYRRLEETERIKEEVRKLEEKAGGRKAGQT